MSKQAVLKVNLRLSPSAGVTSNVLEVWKNAPVTGPPSTTIQVTAGSGSSQPSALYTADANDSLAFRLTSYRDDGEQVSSEFLSYQVSDLDLVPGAVLSVEIQSIIDTDTTTTTPDPNLTTTTQTPDVGPVPQQARRRV